MKVHFELMKCINDQLTRAKHASRSAAEASINDVHHPPLQPSTYTSVHIP